MRENPKAVVRTLSRYLARAMSRETPSGLFAGISVGFPGSEDQFNLRALRDYRAVTTVAPTRLQRLMRELAGRPNVFGRVPQRLNSTAKLLHGSFRFLSTGRIESLTEIEASAAVRSIVTLVREGASADRMVQRLVEQGFRAPAAQASVHELCRLRFLEPEWLPSATGENALKAAIEQLGDLPDLAHDVALLRDVARCLDEADGTALGSNLGLYQRASAHLREGEPSAATRLLSTQLVKPAANLTLSEATQRELLEAASLLQQTGRAPYTALNTFVQRFRARYEERLVPLAEALDPDLGIGFMAELDPSDALIAHLPLRRTALPTKRFDALDAVRLRLLSRALAERSTVCELDDGSLTDMQRAVGAPDRPRRESFAMLTRLARRGDTGELQIVAPTLFTPGELLGRFAVTDQLRGELERLVATEQQLNERSLLVDVAHFAPEEDHANALVRPSLRSYEIPYVGRSGAPVERQLPIDDLLVGIEDERAQLYSIKLRQRVTIRLLNAHGFEARASPSVYRFLGALQDADWTLVNQWSWGALADAEFLPRVVRGNTILSLARWRLPVAELTRLARLDGAQGFEGMQALRGRLSLPRWLVRLEHDQRQLIDLDSELAVEDLLYDAAQRDELVVEELVPTPEQLVLSGPEGKFAAELVVPFVRKHAEPPKPLPLGFELASQPVSKRRFTPGSKWLYVKIYCPRSIVPEVLEQVRGAGSVQPGCWFYVPSADPDPHLRVRWTITPNSSPDVLARVQSALQPFVDRGNVWRWQLATYEQELEDFGGPDHIELAESVFWADSEAAADLLKLAAGDSEMRWLLALAGIDRLFVDFELSLTERAALARKCRDSYAQDQGADGETWRAAKAKYAIHAKEMRELLWQPAERRQGWARQAQEVFDRRSERLAAISREYHRRWSEGRLSLNRAELLHSFAHLHAVRVVGISARRHELLLFDFLRRQYSARIATQARDDAPTNK